ncbi:type IV pilin protein [Candidatus Omnitrophota bacterium]
MSTRGFFKNTAKGFTLVEIMIAVGIVSLLGVIALPGLLRARLSANETFARATLKTISNACESYAASNYGQYPTAMADLIGLAPPYLNQDYTVNPLRGYNFACGLLAITGYSCTATPLRCGQTGTKDFTITTGAVLASVDCI